MNSSAWKQRLQVGAGLTLVAGAVAYAASSALTLGADAKSADPKPAQAKAEQKPKEAKPKKKKELTGAELYAINCNRCHAERYPTEFTAAQWKTLMLHMQVRANLPVAQAKKILKYLQEDSGS